MVKSGTTSITPAEHADRHRHGGADPLTGDVNIGQLPYDVNGESQVLTDPAESNISGAGVYTKAHEILLTKTPDTIKIGFSSWTNIGSGHARIYRNGTAVGIDRLVTGVYQPEFFIESISGWSDGDLLQLYSYAGGNHIYVAGFGVYGRNSDDMYGTIE